MQFLTPEIIEDLDNVRQILSASGVAVHSIERLPGGSRSFAFVADNLVMRFPKAEVIWNTMRREKQIIDAVYPFLDEKLPHKIHKTELVEENYPFSLSLRFNGKICDNRGAGKYTANYTDLSAPQQENLARQIARFFTEMHAIDYAALPIPPVDASLAEAMESWDVAARADFDYDKAKASLLQHTSGKINLDDYATENSETKTALCHNDLSGSNLLINSDEYGVLEGIVDFGNARVIPIIQDFFPLYKISRKLALDTLKIYNRLAMQSISSEQIDGLALKYIGYGLSKCQNEPSAYLLKLLTPFCD